MFLIIADSLFGSFVLSWDASDHLCWSDRLYDALAFKLKARAEQFGQNHLTCDWRVERVTVH